MKPSEALVQRIAALLAHYPKGLNQHEIAQRLDVHAYAVARALEQAYKLNIYFQEDKGKISLME